MKNLFTFSLLIFFFAFAGCKKDKPDDNTQQGVTIKGFIPGAGTGKKENINSLTLDQTEKILVFSGTSLSGNGLDFEFVDVTAETFEVTAEMGTAVALVFLTGNYEYIGTLSTRGLNFLPLGKLSGGANTTIDLSSLTLVGSSVIPTHDAFGNEIQITQAEIDALKEIDSYFESLAQNIDADNDGVADFLNNRQLFVESIFDIMAGTYGINSTDPQIVSGLLDTMNYQVIISGGEGFSMPSTVALTGPEANPYTDISLGFLANPGGSSGFACGFVRAYPADTNYPWGAMTLPFIQGVYNLSLDGENHALAFSNIDGKYHLMYVLPTLQTNIEGKLISFTLDYKLPDGSPVAPENILSNVSLEIHGSQLNYGSPRLTHIPKFIGEGGFIEGIYSYTLPSPVDISGMNSVGIWYEDVLGNTYSIGWR